MTQKALVRDVLLWNTCPCQMDILDLDLGSYNLEIPQLVWGSRTIEDLENGGVHVLLAIFARLKSGWGLEKR